MSKFFAFFELQNMKKKAFILIFFCFATLCQAQTVTWEDFLEDYLASQESDAAQEQLQIQTEDLLELHRNPFEINSATREDFLRLPFMSNAQIDSLLKYRKRYGPFLSMEEVMLSKKIDKQTLDWLCLFCYCKQHLGTAEKPRSTTGRDWRSQITLNYDQPLQRRAGFRHYSKEELLKAPNKEYKGSPWAATMRYRGEYKSRIEWGMTLQNDEGEPFAKKKSKPFDSYSFYATGKGKGLLRSWALGDFRIHYGMGLTVGQGLWSSPLSLVSFQRDTRQGITKHSSADEINFFRGAAGEMSFRGWNFGAFLSFRQLDATLKDGCATALLQTGLHRTPSEIGRKESLNDFTAGAHLDRNFKCGQIGFATLHTHFGLPFTTGTQAYRRYYPTGQDFGNYGIHYALQFGQFSIAGEEAVAEKGGVATLNILRYKFTDYRLNLIALHRYYDKQYRAPFAFAYSAAGHVQNEHGLLVGCNWQPAFKWNLKGYLDYAYHPFSTYHATPSCHSLSLFGQMEYQASKKLTFSIRYRFRTRQEDGSDSTSLLTGNQHNFRLQAHYCIAAVQCVSSLDACCLHPGSGNTYWGKMISQRLTAKWGIMRLSLAGAWFNTDNYQTALHFYEPQLLYQFSIPACFYHGLHGAVIAQTDLGRNLSLAAKFSVTHYTNRNTISSGPQQIDAPTQRCLYFQMNWKF